MKFEIVDDIYKSNNEQLSRLNQLDDNSIKGGKGQIYRSKLISSEKAHDLMSVKIDKIKDNQ